MSNSATSRYRPSFLAAILVPVLALVLACGPGEEPTPVPTPTLPPAVATPTPTQPAVVASPTPTTVAAPSPTPTPGTQPQQGGTLKVVDARYSPGFLIYASAQPLDTRYYAKLHNNLLINYEETKVECELCSEWHLENQGKTMVFTLIPGIKFQDGQELTSADVKYSLRMIMGEVDGIESPKGGVIKEYVASIDTPSKYEVRINLLRPSPFMNVVLGIEVMMVTEDGRTREEMKTKYFGTGPFILKRAISGASWSLERNPNYWKQGQPYIDKIDITVVAEEATRMAATVTGVSDYLIFPGAPPPQYRPTFYKMAQEGKVVITTQETQPIYCGHQGFFFNQGSPPFDNLKLRQAFNLALDKKLLGNIQHGDIAMANIMGMAEGMYFSQPESEVWNVMPGWGTGAKKQQEIEQAKQLVKDAGYPNGLDIRQIVRDAITASDPAEPVQQMLGVVGIRSKLDLMPMPVSYERMQKGDYDVSYAGNCVATMDPDENVGVYFLTGSARNWFFYSNPKVDQLFLQMSSELAPPKRKALFHQIRDIIIFEDVVYVPTMGGKPMQVWQTRVQGYKGGISIAHASSGFERADRLWLKQ